MLTQAKATNVDLFIFGTAEPATSIMAASMPILRVLFHRRHPRPAGFVDVSEDGRVAGRALRKGEGSDVLS